MQVVYNVESQQHGTSYIPIVVGFRLLCYCMYAGAYTWVNCILMFLFGVRLSTRALPGEKNVQRYEYSSYLHNINPIVFAILSAFYIAKFQFCNTIVTEVSLFGYIIYYSADLHLKFKK